MMMELVRIEIERYNLDTFSNHFISISFCKSICIFASIHIFFKMFIDIKNENCLYQKTLHNSPWLYEWGNIFLRRFVGYVIITSDVERFNHISIENSKWVCTECRSELRYTGAFDKMLKGIYRQLNIMQCVKIW